MKFKFQETLKAWVAGGTAFLAYVASRGVELPWFVEGPIVASFAAAAVFFARNTDVGEDEDEEI